MTTTQPRLEDNPLLDLARTVWNRGQVDRGAVPARVADLLARGWLRPPLDGELLARARADVVAARETLRKTNGRVAMLEAQLAASEAKLAGSDAELGAGDGA